MQTNNYIKKQLTNALEHLAMVTGDVPENLVNAAPIGTTSAIGAIYAHALLTADVLVNVALVGGAPVVFTTGAAEKLGISDPNPRNWDALKAIKFDLAALHAYAADVLKSVDAYADTLSNAELDRTFNFSGMDLNVADTLMIVATHAVLHAGEISALKGLKGLQGYPD